MRKRRWLLAAAAALAAVGVGDHGAALRMFYGMRTVDVHIVRLRSKLEGSGLKIETVWGSGYRLVEAVPA